MESASRLSMLVSVLILLMTDPGAFCSGQAADQAGYDIEPSAAPQAQEILAQPDCEVVLDARGIQAPRCYQSFEREAAHSIVSKFAAMNSHFNFAALGWTNNSDHPCKFPRWDGVSCEERRVGMGDSYEVILTKWDLEQFCTSFARNGDRKLVGELPVEFGNLTNLRTLVVRDCSMLYGAIPAALVRLPWLNVLDLSRNDLLNGSIDGILDLIADPFYEIDQINFSKNRFSGEIPLPSSMTTLKSLDLSGNNFGTLSSEWCSKNVSFGSNLNYLNVSDNNLTGAFCLDTVRLIEEVDISDNCFDSLSASNVNSLNISGVALKYIYAKNNRISTFPAEVLQWPNVQEMYLDNNTISGVLSLPYVYTATSNLGTVSLVNNNISDITWKSEGTSLLDEQHLRNLELILLLGGNPICKAPPKNEEMRDLLRIVCRFDKSSPIPAPFRKTPTMSKFKIDVILCSSLGIFASLSILIAYFAIKLRKQIKHEQELLEALSKVEVYPRFYPFLELKRATRKFSEGNKLGEGAFGIVYKGRLSDGTLVAIKRLRRSTTETMLREFFNEVVVISSIRHKHLVQLKGCCITASERILVYELVDNMNLSEALWDRPVRCFLDWEARFNIIVGIAEGLSYLHISACRPVIHRDIKPPNILLDGKLDPKIADFGIALLYKDLDDETHQSVTTIAGTRGYLAHEYANLGHVSPKLDVFSYGVLLLEIVSGRRCLALNLPSPQNCLYEWAWKLYKQGQILDLVDPAILGEQERSDLAVIERVLIVGLKCTSHLPSSRPSMAEVVDQLLGKTPVVINQ